MSEVLGHRTTIYLPIDVMKLTKTYGMNVSRVCAEAIRAEAARQGLVPYVEMYIEPEEAA